MEGVDHVHIREVGGCRLVGEVDRVGEGQIPDGEGLKLGVARLDAALVVVVELREAGCHLAAAGAGRGDNDQRALGLDIVVLAVALLAGDQLCVGGVTGDRIVAEDAHAEVFQPLDEGVCGGLPGVLRDDDRADIQPDAGESVDQPDCVRIVGDAEVGAHLVLRHRHGGDDDHNFRLVFNLHQHADLAVRGEAGQHARRMKVVKQLAAELEIELAAEQIYPLAYVCRLHLQIFVVVKTDLEHPVPRKYELKFYILLLYAIPRPFSRRFGKIRKKAACPGCLLTKRRLSATIIIL